MGDVQLLRGHSNPAIAHYRMALRQNPDLPGASQNLAAALRRAGEHAERIATLERAIRHAPRDGALLAALAFALATAPQPELRRGEQALDYANRALAADRRPRSRGFDAHAAALAELGRFEAARQSASRALDLARAEQRSDLIPGLETRLAEYRSARPHRDVVRNPSARGPGTNRP
jgi:tetratricopeptide (TPR) repeat protein